MIFPAVTGKKVDAMTIEPNFLATVPSSGSIGVRKPTVAFVVPITIFFTCTVLNSIVRRGNRKTGTIASCSKS